MAYVMVLGDMIFGQPVTKLYDPRERIKEMQRKSKKMKSNKTLLPQKIREHCSWQTVGELDAAFTEAMASLVSYTLKPVLLYVNRECITNSTQVMGLEYSIPFQPSAELIHFLMHNSSPYQTICGPKK